MPDFWVLQERDKIARRGEHVCQYDIEEPQVVEQSDVRCPVCNAFAAPAIWMPPRKAKIETKDIGCGDLLLGVAYELVVSSEFRNIYMKTKLSGLSGFEPLEVIGTKREYFTSRPKIILAKLDETASGVSYYKAPTCEHCGLGAIKSLDRLVLDPTNWDGSDIFMATGAYNIKLVTNSFCKQVEQAKLTNFVFIPAGEYHFP